MAADDGIPGMMDYQYIDSDRALNEACHGWQDESLIALDTEFVRTDTYYPNAGLLQLSTGDRHFLIDPLTIGDWNAFRAVLENPAVIKLLHACSEDLEVFRRLLGTVPEPLLDTQIGAALAGLDSGLSYQKLVHQCLDIDIPKGETRSDWLQRPLSDSQCHYAVLDVAWLPAVYRELSRRLTAQGRLSWWQEDCRRLLADIAQPTDSALSYLRIRAATQLDRRQLAALQRICQWREEQARERDIPRQWLVSDLLCVEMARRLPRNLPQLAALPGMARGVVRREGESLLALIDEALAFSNEALPELPAFLGREENTLLKALRSEVRRVAGELDIAAEALARRRDLEQLLLYQRDHPGQLSPAFHGWREALIGEALLAELQRCSEERERSG